MTTIHCYKHVLITQKDDGRFYVNIPGKLSSIAHTLEGMKGELDALSRYLPQTESEYQCAPVCTEGEKRSLTTCGDGSTIHGEVCNNNAWVPSGEKCPSPEPGVEPVPPADEMFTIEFQELIPGIKPPRVPILVPGLETLPLLPGWIVRDAAGNIVNEGMELPKIN